MQLQQGPFFLGREYSVIDPYLLMLSNWHESPRCSCSPRIRDCDDLCSTLYANARLSNESGPSISRNAIQTDNIAAQNADLTPARS